MDRWKRLLAFLFLNVIVTALTMWVVLTLWTRANPLPAVDLPANSATPATASTGAPASLPTAAPGAPATAGQLEINTVVAAGDVDNERVLIRHIGQEEIALAGWELEDEDGNTFVFPALRMFSGGAVTVYTRAGVNTVVELYWGQDAAVWQSGETVTLRDPDGNLQAEYLIP